MMTCTKLLMNRHLPFSFFFQHLSFVVISSSRGVCINLKLDKNFCKSLQRLEEIYVFWRNGKVSKILILPSLKWLNSTCC